MKDSFTDFAEIADTAGGRTPRKQVSGLPYIVPHRRVASSGQFRSR